MHFRELLNGLIAGLTMPLITYAFLQLVNWGIAILFLPRWDSFSLKLTAIMCLLGNILPVVVFNKQERTSAMQGTIAVTLMVAMGILYYFWDAFMV